MRPRGAADYQRPKQLVPGDPHTELDATDVLVGTLHRKTQKTAVRVMFLVFVHQEATGIHNRPLTVQFLNRALVTALSGAELHKRMTGLFMDQRDVHRTTFHGEDLQHFLHIVAIHGLDGINAVIPDHVAGFLVGQMRPTRANGIHDDTPCLGMVGQVVGKGLRRFGQQPLHTLVSHVLHERHNGLLRVEERR